MQRAVAARLLAAVSQAERCPALFSAAQTVCGSVAPLHSLHGAGTGGPASLGWQRPPPIPWTGPTAAQQVRGMFIKTQPTPNPDSLMFVPGKPVMESGTYHFHNAREAAASPLAAALFRVDGVTAVFFGSDFVTVTKVDGTAWQVLKPDIFAAMMDFFSSGKPLFTGNTTTADDTAAHPDDSEVVAMVKELLETRIRPAVQEDGGDIVFRSFDPDTGVVVLKMQGACSGCPSSSVTLKSGIENMLMHYIPEVKQVIEAPPDEYEEKGAKEFEELEKRLREGAKDGEGSGAAPAASPLEQHLSV